MESRKNKQSLPGLKAFLSMVFVVFALAFGSLIVLANENSVIVLAEALNVRYGPGLSHDVMTQVREKEKLQVIDEQNQWYKVRLNNDQIGWVASWLVEKENISPNNTKYGRIVNAPEVNLRQFASADSQLIGTIPEGAEIEVLYQNGKWYQILYQGMVAWIHGEYVEIIDSPTSVYSVDVSGGVQEPLIQVGPHQTNIRSAPSEVSEIIAKAKPNETFTYLHTEGDWYCVQLSDNQVGYIASWVSEMIDLKDKNGKAVSEKQAESYASYYARSSTHLAEATIVIDPGHGGTDPGAISADESIYEKNIALQTAKILRDRLVAAGANVIMTRTNDSSVSLSDRAAVSNQYNADLFISLHYDSREIPNTGSGTTTYYYSDKDYPLAQFINSFLTKQVPLPNNGVNYGNFQVLRDNQRPALLFELGYMNNDLDVQYINNPTYQSAVADSIFQALQAYFSGE